MPSLPRQRDPAEQQGDALGQGRRGAPVLTSACSRATDVGIPLGRSRPRPGSAPSAAPAQSLDQLLARRAQSAAARLLGVALQAVAVAAQARRACTIAEQPLLRRWARRGPAPAPARASRARVENAVRRLAHLAQLAQVPRRTPASATASSSAWCDRPRRRRTGARQCPSEARASSSASARAAACRRRAAPDASRPSSLHRRRQHGHVERVPVVRHQQVVADELAEPRPRPRRRSADPTHRRRDSRAPPIARG